MDFFNEEHDKKIQNLKQTLINFNTTCTEVEAFSQNESDEKFIRKLEAKLHDILVLIKENIVSREEFLFLLNSSVTLDNLFKLLKGDNAKLILGVVGILKDITSADLLEDAVFDLMQSMLKKHLIVLLVYTIQRMNQDDKDQYNGTYDILKIVSNCFLLGNKIVDKSSSKYLMTWLLKHLRMTKNYSKKLVYGSELMHILLRDNEDHRQVFRELEKGLETVLNQTGYFHHHDPKTQEERTIMSNIFDIICDLLTAASFRHKFLQLDGLSTMLNIIKTKRAATVCAVKVLSYALYGPNGEDSCNKLIKLDGLAILFDIGFNQFDGVNSESIEEYVRLFSSIVVSLIRNCGSVELDELSSYFKRDEYMELNNLLSLYFQYYRRIHNIYVELPVDTSNNDTYRVYLQLGYHTLQLITFTLVWLSQNDCQIYVIFLKALNKKRCPLREVQFILWDFANNLPKEGLKEWQNQEAQRIMVLTKKFMQTNVCK